MAGPPGGAGPAVSTLVLPNGGPGQLDARPRGTGPASGNRPEVSWPLHSPRRLDIGLSCTGGPGVEGRHAASSAHLGLEEPNGDPTQGHD